MNDLERELLAIVAIMEPYTRSRPGITVKQALELRATARREEQA